MLRARGALHVRTRAPAFLVRPFERRPQVPEVVLPPELRVAGRVDQAAFERGLITLSTQPTRDGYAGDQTLFAPPFTTTDEELGEMVARFAEAVRAVARDVETELAELSARPQEVRG